MARSSCRGQVMTESLLLVFLLVLVSLFVFRLFHEAQSIHRKARWEAIQ